MYSESQFVEPSTESEGHEEDSFLSALVAESEIEPAVKAVFESGKAQEYVEKLDQYIIRKEKEIQDICSRNYQGFISAVDELLQVRSETLELRDSVISLNQGIQSSGEILIKHVRRVIFCEVIT